MPVSERTTKTIRKGREYPLGANTRRCRRELRALLSPRLGGISPAVRRPERRADRRHPPRASRYFGSKKAKKTLDDGTRSSLQAAGAAIATVVASLL